MIRTVQGNDYSSIPDIHTHVRLAEAITIPTIINVKLCRWFLTPDFSLTRSDFSPNFATPITGRTKVLDEIRPKP